MSRKNSSKNFAELIRQGVIKKIRHDSDRKQTFKELYGDLGITAKEFCQSIEKQVGDPYEFMRLAGVNLNDPATFNKMINDGNDVKNYLTKKEKELEEKRE